MGERDPWRYLEFLYGCKRPRGDIQNLCVGVRDPWRYPEFLCRCKRPVEISRISEWV